MVFQINISAQAIRPRKFSYIPIFPQKINEFCQKIFQDVYSSVSLNFKMKIYIRIFLIIITLLGIAEEIGNNLDSKQGKQGLF